MASERFIIVPDEIAKHLRLTPADKLVYGAMLALSRKTGCCFASHERIGDRLGLSRETVCRSVERLKDARCIRAVDGPLMGGYGDGRTKSWECLYDVKKRKPKLVSMLKVV